MATGLWILGIIIVIMVLYFKCNGTIDTTTKSLIAPQKFTELLLPRRQPIAVINHKDTFLGSLFSHELDALPEGMTREQFEREVARYQQEHLKTPELKIPRSLNFNYNHYSQEQEQMRRNISASARQFVHRDAVGEITEKLAKIQLPPTSQRLIPRTFKKVVSKR